MFSFDLNWQGFLLPAISNTARKRLMCDATQPRQGFAVHQHVTFVLLSIKKYNNKLVFIQSTPQIFTLFPDHIELELYPLTATISIEL